MKKDGKRGKETYRERQKMRRERERDREWMQKREAESTRENGGRGGATVCNRGSRKREETSSIGAAKRGGKASEGARRREKERKRERRQ